MCYDPNSPQAKLGALGEEIVKRYLEQDFSVKKPSDTFASGASIVGFELFEDGNLTGLVEVKVQSSYPYGIEQAPCYSFPASRINTYLEYSNARGLPLRLYVVDPSTETVFQQTLRLLHLSTTIDGRKFPFDKAVRTLGGVCRYFHTNQFEYAFTLSDEDVNSLRAITNGKDITAINEPENTPPAPLKVETPCLNPNLLTKPKFLIEQLGHFAGVGNQELIQAILDLRQKKFEREQAQFKELFS